MCERVILSKKYIRALMQKAEKLLLESREYRNSESIQAAQESFLDSIEWLSSALEREQHTREVE